MSNRVRQPTPREEASALFSLAALARLTEERLTPAPAPAPDGSDLIDLRQLQAEAMREGDAGVLAPPPIVPLGLLPLVTDEPPVPRAEARYQLAPWMLVAGGVAIAGAILATAFAIRMGPEPEVLSESAAVANASDARPEVSDSPPGPEARDTPEPEEPEPRAEEPDDDPSRTEPQPPPKPKAPPPSPPPLIPRKGPPPAAVSPSPTVTPASKCAHCKGDLACNIACRAQ